MMPTTRSPCLPHLHDFLEYIPSSTLVLHTGPAHCFNTLPRDDMPLFIVLKAMGCESDQEGVLLAGGEPWLATRLAPSIMEAKARNVHTEQQALNYLGAPYRKAHTKHIVCVFAVFFSGQRWNALVGMHLLVSSLWSFMVF